MYHENEDNKTTKTASAEETLNTEKSQSIAEDLEASNEKNEPSATKDMDPEITAEEISSTDEDNSAEDTEPSEDPSSDDAIATEESIEETEEDNGEDETEDEVREDEKKPSSLLRFLYETLEMVAISIAIVIMLITFVVRYSPVSGESMTYTINEGDSLLVQIAGYEPQRNDIVIIQAPNYDLNKPLIKRIIAVGGDELFINFNTWEVKVNGVTLDEDYVRHNPFIYNPEGDKVDPETPMDHQSVHYITQGVYNAENNTFSATVPEGTIFVMGDNRNNSHDSRSANVGFVDEKCVVGRAVFRLYPFSSIGTLE